jgi:hypothetical protein
MKTNRIDLNLSLYEEPVTPKHKLPKNGPCKMCFTYSTNCYICDAAVCENNHIVSSSKTMDDCDYHYVISVVKRTLCSVIYEAKLPPMFQQPMQKNDKDDKDCLCLTV